MKIRNFAAILALAALLCLRAGAAHAQETMPESRQIDQQAEIDALKERLAVLEQALAESRAEQDSKVQQVKDAVSDPEGVVQTAVSDVSKLKKIKVSGYVQTRYETYQSPEGMKNLADNKTSDNRFYIRRGRFKITGQPTNNTVGVVQLDISGFDRTKVETKDLYLEYHPWGIGVSAPFFIRAGQQNWPFGYVVERSSSAREVPERPKVFAGTAVGLSGYPSFNGLFLGERDKGIALFSTQGSKIDWALGLFNGTGTKSGDPGKAFLESGGKFEDNNSIKTVAGRIRYPVTENLNVGVSGFAGSQAVRTVSDASSAVNVNQTRWGADFQYYLQGGSIKGEYVAGKEPYFSNTSTMPNTTSGTNRTVKGWYLVGVKNLDARNQLVAQCDVLDDAALEGSFGRLSSWNLGIVRLLDNATKLKLFYEISNEEKNEVHNDGLRIDMITVF
jgi:hypothetical protein